MAAWDVAETSDYYRLLDRAPGHAHVTYTLDEQGRIAAVPYEPFKDPHAPPNRWNEFKAWADANANEEFEQVAPGGKIVPGREQARVWRRLLTRLHQKSGLPVVPAATSASDSTTWNEPGRSRTPMDTDQSALD